MTVNKIKHAFDKERDSLAYMLEKTKENNEYDIKIAVSKAITGLKEDYDKIKNREIVDAFDVYVLPIMNPDGSVFTVISYQFHG